MVAMARHFVCLPLVAVQLLLAVAGAGFHIDAECGPQCAGDERSQSGSNSRDFCSHSHCRPEPRTDEDDGRDEPGSPFRPHNHDECVVCQYYAHLKLTTIATVAIPVERAQPHEEPATARFTASDASRSFRPRAPPVNARC